MREAGRRTSHLARRQLRRVLTEGRQSGGTPRGGAGPASLLPCGPPWRPARRLKLCSPAWAAGKGLEAGAGRRTCPLCAPHAAAGAAAGLGRTRRSPECCLWDGAAGPASTRHPAGSARPARGLRVSPGRAASWGPPNCPRPPEQPAAALVQGVARSRALLGRSSSEITLCELTLCGKLYFHR